jgi:predicted dehydrogenase
MGASGQVRWGILGAANIARGQFLPGLRETGDGVAVAVGSRDLARGQEFATREGVQRAVQDYDAVLADPEIDAVYIALPNSHHADWTIKAIEAGKHVLCEKPLCAVPSETERVLAVAHEHPEAPLWEAFVFPFQSQHERIVELIDSGAIGAVREIDSAFHFRLGSPDNIRLSAALGGGALADVGCYPIRLAHELLGPVTERVSVDAWVDGEVEVDAAALVSHGDQRLLLSCGARAPTRSSSARCATPTPLPPRCATSTRWCEVSRSRGNWRSTRRSAPRVRSPACRRWSPGERAVRGGDRLLSGARARPADR